MPPHYPLFFLIDPPDRKPLIRPRKSSFPEASRKNLPTAVSPSVFRATPITHGTVQLYPIRMRLKGAPVRLEQTRPAGYPIRFEGRGDGETDGLVRPALVGDDEIGGGKRVAPPARRIRPKRRTTSGLLRYTYVLRRRSYTRPSFRLFYECRRSDV